MLYTACAAEDSAWYMFYAFGAVCLAICDLLRRRIAGILKRLFVSKRSVQSTVHFDSTAGIGLKFAVSRIIDDLYDYRTRIFFVPTLPLTLARSHIHLSR